MPSSYRMLAERASTLNGVRASTSTLTNHRTAKESCQSTMKKNNNNNNNKHNNAHNGVFNVAYPDFFSFHYPRLMEGKLYNDPLVVNESLKRISELWKKQKASAKEEHLRTEQAQSPSPYQSFFNHHFPLLIKSEKKRRDVDAVNAAQRKISIMWKKEKEKRNRNRRGPVTPYEIFFQKEFAKARADVSANENICRIAAKWRALKKRKDGGTVPASLFSTASSTPCGSAKGGKEQRTTKNHHQQRQQQTRQTKKNTIQRR